MARGEGVVGTALAVCAVGVVGCRLTGPRRSTGVSRAGEAVRTGVVRIGREDRSVERGGGIEWGSRGARTPYNEVAVRVDRRRLTGPRRSTRVSRTGEAVRTDV